MVVPAAAVRHVRAATTGRRQVHAARGRVEARRPPARPAGPARPRVRPGGCPLLVLRLLLGDRAARARLPADPPGRPRPRRAARGRLRCCCTRAGWPRCAGPAAATAHRAGPRRCGPCSRRRRARARARAEAFGDWFSGGSRAARRRAPDSAGWATPARARPTSSTPTPRRRPRSGARPWSARACCSRSGCCSWRWSPSAPCCSTGGGLLAGGRLLPAARRRPRPVGGLRRLLAAGLRRQPGARAARARRPGRAVHPAARQGLARRRRAAARPACRWPAPPRTPSPPGVVRHTALRLWAGATWALLPVATGAVAAGRLDAAAVQVALPLLLLAGARLLDRRPAHGGLAARLGPRARAWPSPCAFAPVLLPLAAVLLLGGGARRPGAGAAADAGPRPCVAGQRPRSSLRRAASRCSLPWGAGAAGAPRPAAARPRPARRGRRAGRPPRCPAGTCRCCQPGGAGLPPVWVTVGLLLAAAGGALRDARRPLAARRLGLARSPAWPRRSSLTRTTVAAAGTAELPVWPGTALQVAAAGLLLAAARRRRRHPRPGSPPPTSAARQLDRRAWSPWPPPPSPCWPPAPGWCAAPTTRCAATSRPCCRPSRRPSSRPSPAPARWSSSPRDGRGRVRAHRRRGRAARRRHDPPRRPASAAALDAVVADLLTPSGSAAARRAVHPRGPLRRRPRGERRAGRHRGGARRRSPAWCAAPAATCCSGRSRCPPAASCCCPPALAAAARAATRARPPDAARATPPVVLRAVTGAGPAGRRARPAARAQRGRRRGLGRARRRGDRSRRPHRLGLGERPSRCRPRAGRCRSSTTGRRAAVRSSAQALALGLVLVLAAPGPGSPAAAWSRPTARGLTAPARRGDRRRRRSRR